jgi:MFS superfamily sulfate permease-like transporter
MTTSTQPEGWRLDPPQAAAQAEIPRGNLAGLRKFWKQDLLSGFLVFLIALPLCLAISIACKYPPIAGVFTAIIGGVLTTFLSNSELTIKGPAAGLITIASGCVLGFMAMGNDPTRAYHMALGVGIAAGVIQILLGLLRAGALCEFAPTSAVHGMLAAIGVIIIAKQVPVALGVTPTASEPLELLAEIPWMFGRLNPQIALIGGVSLLILFGLPLIKNRYLKRIPAPMFVLLVAVPLGLYFNLDQKHTYTFLGQAHEVSDRFLVAVPSNMFDAVTVPDFSGLATVEGWKWVLMFVLIGSLESVLSAKAIDMLDPWRRKTNLNRDLLAVGAANTLSAAVGGLPMISEIVRSKANIDNGARTRFADMFHGLLLLSFVALVPWLIHRIPLAALGAMLVYTGFRLTSPKEFAKVYKVGREQLLVFVTTIVAVLATDLLIGIGIGIAVEFFVYLVGYPPLRSLFVPAVTVEDQDAKTYMVRVRYAAVFSNWIALRGRVAGLDAGRDVVIDLSETVLVDHTVMEKLHDLEKEFEESNRRLIITGLEKHEKFSEHPHAGRKKGYV